MKSFFIKQGDACAIPIVVKLNGAAVSTDDIAQAEFMLGGRVRRTWPEEVAYEDGAFRFPLTQKETFSLREGLTLPLDVRVKFTTGDVLGALSAGQVTVVDALSTEEL